ncbi:MAG: cytochrome P450 [Pseudonocardia sp.]|uniref:cytochrome P450 n=1 Tax=unclassified Pseudonocardia TaxID=2619320 RepID=UPI00086C12E1|nr:MULTISPECIES: cytochrome P450 [unclassified Pseudonocardia]MBN9112423.1 cytochrome P450 [Pseudonocardia sp.]ODU27305.1 MAG: hypothetical protein ABS80_03970 [Pseudonocardia sp. SCN 72-51]ODV08918.1 MAG: hypothetical protein ABT15_01360 [Pseudonocardia sp. SCN 73-27]
MVEHGPDDRTSRFSSFDFFDDAFSRDPAPTWGAMRDACPVAHSDHFGGHWIPTGYDTIRAVTLDTETYSSADATVPAVPGATAADYPPISMDPPRHTGYRRAVMGFFTTGNVRRLEQVTREVANYCLDALEDSDIFDAGYRFAQRIPLAVISHLLGVTEDDADRFAEWIEIIPEAHHADISTLMTMLTDMNEVFTRTVRAAREEPRDSIVSRLLTARVDGHLLDDDALVRVCRVLMVAAIDTTWTVIGGSLAHLASHPGDRRRLAALTGDADLGSPLWDTAVEEFLRYFAPVTVGRRATRDTELEGCPVPEGGRLLLQFGAANRDPSVFDDADDVRLDRRHNPHLTFGAGIHRCLGAALATMELRVALQTFLRRVPEFHVPAGSALQTSRGSVRGVKGFLVARGPAPLAG